MRASRQTALPLHQYWLAASEASWRLTKYICRAQFPTFGDYGHVLVDVVHYQDIRSGGLQQKRVDGATCQQSRACFRTLPCSVIAAAYHSHAFGASRKRSITQRHIRDATRAGNRPLKSGTVHASLIFSPLSLKTTTSLDPLVGKQGDEKSEHQGDGPNR